MPTCYAATRRLTSYEETPDPADGGQDARAAGGHQRHERIGDRRISHRVRRSAYVAPPRPEVRVVGIGDHLTELRETIDEWRPHVVFNLLDEFSGIISYDHYVVAYLELIQQRYTGCNPRGMMLSRDKVLTKRVLATHRVATPAFRLFPFGRRFREPSRLTFRCS